MRQSALRFSAALSARSRSTSAKRSRISSALGRCATSHPFRSQSRKRIVAPEHDRARLLQKCGEKRVAARDLRAKLVERIDDRIDLPPQSTLRVRNPVHHFLEWNGAEDEEVEIALLAQRTART